jgi:hypothetical protein
MKDLKPRKEQLKGVQARSPELANMEVQMAVFEVFETGVPIYTGLKLFRKPWDLESVAPGPNFYVLSW